jgi:adenosine deaminase
MHERGIDGYRSRTYNRLLMAAHTRSWRNAIKPVGTLTRRSEWVRELPKIELHLHLEGAMRPETVRELSVERLGWSGTLEPGWENSYYTYTDFSGFMAQLTPRFPGRADEYGRIARECIEDLAAQGVVYSEMSIDVPVREVGDDSFFWPVFEAMESERRAAQERLPIRINFIAGLMRTLPVEVAIYRTELAIAARDRGIAVVGIDLHGDERLGSTDSFAPAYRLAEANGLGLRAHAGEAVGPESMWSAINALGARRLVHGARAAEDPALVERLRLGDVTLEMCPTSNVRTASVPDLPSHPVRRFYDMGIPVTVNSDDPLPFFTNVERECRLLVDEFGFSRGELMNLMLTAANAAFLPASERQELAELLETSYDPRAREAV